MERTSGAEGGPGAADPAQPTAQPPTAQPPAWPLALLVAGCFFLENLDATIVTTAAPTIGTSLNVAASSVGLVITSYLLALAVLLPVSGWLAVRLGARPVFTSAIVVFTVASAACALSRTLPELVALRALQGAGGAMMVPVGRLVVLSRTARSDLMRVIAWLTWPGLLAPVAAPLVGGLIVTHTSWRVIFLVNVPLGVVAVLAALRLVPGAPLGTGASRPLDAAGVLLTGGGLAAAAWTVHLVADASVGASAAVWALAALALCVAAVVHLRSAAAPLVDLGTLRVTTLRASVLGSSTFWLVVGAVPFLLPLLFQEVFGWSPVTSGAVVLCVFAGNVAIKPATGPLLRRFGVRTVLLAATVGVALTVAALGLVREGTPLPVVAALCAASGVVRSVGFTTYNTMALADVEPADVPSANTLVVTFQQLSAAFAIAAGSLGLRLGRVAAPHLAGHALLRGPAAPYGLALWLLALVALLATASASRLPPGAGDAVTGAGRRQPTSARSSSTASQRGPRPAR